MIELITGKPGAGKTYLAVMRLLELPVGKYVVYTNIDGLRADAFPEPNMVKRIESDIPSWCTKANMTKWSEGVQSKYGRNMLIVIDEAQMWFGERNQELKGWLSWHRHLGQDIWLIAQHSRMIHLDYVNLCEYEIRAMKNTIFNMFLYQYRIGGESYRTVRKKTDQKVFGAYKSFDLREEKKKGSNLVYYAIGFGVLGLTLFIGGVKWFSSKANASVPVPLRGVERVKERERVHKKESLAVVVDPWETISYAGVMGNVVLVQRMDGGGLCDLGQVVNERYGVVRSNGKMCEVVTGKGVKRVIHRKSIRVEGDAAEERRRTAPPNEAKRG